MSATADSRFLGLAEELESSFEAWENSPEAWSDEYFETLALREFALQYEANLPYGRYCRSIARDPTSVSSWTEIPPVPAAAFRHVDLIVGRPADAELRFRTSGTTGGAASRGVHPVRRSETYAASLAGPFLHFVLSGHPVTTFLVVHAPFESTADSSLSWMFDRILSRFGAPGSVRLDPASGLTPTKVVSALQSVAEAGDSVVIMGTTLALAEILGALEESGAAVTLPTGSRVMDTGGAKGRAGLDRSAVLGSLLSRLGLESEAAVNEFGMTELLSQRYGVGLGPVELHGPPWLRARVLHPVTLEPVDPGEEGVLCHYDLANAGSVFAVLTEDRGRQTGSAIEWLGRIPGAPPRGCSLATAELLEAQRV